MLGRKTSFIPFEAVDVYKNIQKTSGREMETERGIEKGLIERRKYTASLDTPQRSVE